MIIHIIANAALGPSLSGGDRIFIECARRWANLGHQVNVYIWEEGLEMCQRNKLNNVNLIIWPIGSIKRLGFTLGYFIRTIKGCLEAFRITASKEESIVYSASDFWPDSLPAFLMSRKLKAPWVAAFYLFAPNPFRGFTKEFQIPSLKNIFYFLSQKFIYWLIKKFADLVFVTYDLDRIPFIKQGIPQEKVKAIYGGVDIETIGKVKPSAKNRYTACFVGRFHPQKGLKELVSIWKLVCQQKKTAQLALIGTGEKETVAWLKQQFKKKNLSKNVSFFGFLDGIEKYKILKSSKVYLCSNLYDSGGMATIEAMACGLPVVSFDIPQIRSLIPKGTLRVPFRDTEVFAREILRVLEDNKLSAKISKEGLSLAKDWDWGKRAERILNFCKAITKEEK